MVRSRPGNAKVVIIVVVVVLGVMFMMCAGLMVALLLPAVQAARTAARQTQSSNNLKQIEIALLNYESTYGCYPSAYMPDADGKPMHSWRVAILPFVEESYMFDQYDFSQPWDSPHNLQVTKSMPLVYANPALSKADIDQGLTSYVALAGPNTVLATQGWRKISEIVNGMSSTINVVDDLEHPVPWSKPDDISPEEFLSMNVNENAFRCTLVGYCDGSVRPLGEDDRYVFQQQVTIDGK
ncbi:DUF1559 domain-containing protein [bacterium]|nr:DUF1559 domain-containing protein [bacterium]